MKSRIMTLRLNIIKTAFALVLVSIAFMVFSFISKSIETKSVQTLSSYGSTGNEVVQIQTRLKNWGYYFGDIDGIFGPLTQSAVISFQRKNGLTPDGIVGPATLRALGLPAGNSSYGNYSSSDYYLLARLISAEARGEPYVGQVAVGAVVLNRVEHPSFPNTIAGVIYQPGAFTCLQDGQFNQPVVESAYRAAQDALNGWDPSNGSIYYYNPATATSAWIWSRPVLLRIGNHVFCK
ncbi:spore cortex-lytic protein [[Clostridium] cellulosi]|jgi:spore cortex-lytic enzyme|uniref:Spore cortex-lytic enzyme n=1 Tax=[Clostridium] cellulosi TaxID=29343 RepID=A0A078KR68_9FIRM|nr:spore cortex-lytic protein [[Clostridium] cellulosi]